MPALIVGSALVMSGSGALGRAPASPSVDLTAFPCSLLVQGASGEGTSTQPPGSHVVQPLGATANLSGCSLDVEPNGDASSTLSIVSWNPATLAPDARTVALRTYAFGVSSMQYSGPGVTFHPPLVLKALAGVAEAPAPIAAIDYRIEASQFYSVPQWLHWTPSPPPGTPTAYQIEGALATPFAGSGGAIAHEVCGGDPAIQNEFVCQSVVRCDAAFGTPYQSVAQRFRVPTRTQLGWIELAFGQHAGTGTVAICDAAGQGGMPATRPTPLAQAPFPVLSSFAWGSHADFDQSITLQPAHDYWLWVTTDHNVDFFVRTLDGSENSTFHAAVGELWSRGDSTAAWTQETTHTLAFKVVGTPVDLLGAPPSESALQGVLSLRVTPNPASGSVRLSWRGARGAVRIEWLDVRGRRLATTLAGSSPDGEWQWSAAERSGHPPEPGIYFARATDAAGRTGLARVVIVR